MTFLRWAGSKKQILSELSSSWFAVTNNQGEEKCRYIEGFSGSASLFFHLKPSSAVLVDVNKNLQQCLGRVRAEPKGVAIALSKFETGALEYYRLRGMDRSCLKPNEKAAVFIYLNRYCFNGLYRTNQLGQFNVPFGGGKSGALPSYAQLLKYSKILQSAELVTGDFYDSIAPIIRCNDFIYLDPPYAKRNATLDNQYGPDVFGMNDLARLQKLLKKADEQGAKFLVSYANCEEISTIASEWHHEIVSVRRTIAADAKRRGMAEEVLITNI